MSLYTQLQAAQSEEDVKDAYIKALGLKGYQIRNALAERNKSGDTAPVNFSPMETAYAALTDKLRPMVFSLGFLR